MAFSAMCARSVAFLALLVMTQALTLDEEATNNVLAIADSVRENGEIALVLRGPHGKNNRREELLHVKGPEDHSFSVYYNRRSNKVTLESLNGGHLKSVSWDLSSHTKGTLTLVASNRRVKLNVGCVSLHWHGMPSRHDLMTLLGSQKLKLYHEDNSPVEVFSTEKAALDSISCDLRDDIIPPALTETETNVDETDVEEVKEFIRKDAKRQEEQMQGDDYRNNNIDANAVINGVLKNTGSDRGDIPSIGIESCDDEVIRHLQLLTKTIETLRREIADQKGTIDNLRGQLRQCCNRFQQDRCTSSSCHPGY